MKYRSDIDGLRGFAVLLVIAFHYFPNTFNNGFLGVDLFFVISGYLVTANIIAELDRKTFSFRSFYQRRIARLAPAYLFTVVITVLGGAVVSTPLAFDRFGKELAYSAVGAVNFLNAAGLDYFNQEAKLQPFHHLWSLGVEEQFYAVWPIILIGAVLCDRSLNAAGRIKTTTILLLIVLSLLSSVYLSVSGQTSAYFNPWFRAYELLIGAMIATPYFIKNKDWVSNIFKNRVAGVGVAVLCLSLVLTDKTKNFPGYQAALPCIAAALLIWSGPQTTVGRILSMRVLVFVGLVSYPLYLLHQPLLCLVQQIPGDNNSPLVALFVGLVSLLLSIFVWKFFEQPIRYHTKHSRGVAQKITVLLLLGIATSGAIGFTLARTGGWPSRLYLFNQDVADVYEAQLPTFSQHFKRGAHCKSLSSQKVLFVGDSVLQQYVFPLQRAWGLEKNQIETITRGGCVLLPDIPFVDQFSDIPQHTLMQQIQEVEGPYRAIVFSQSWTGYKAQKWFKDISKENEQNSFETWKESINAVVERYSELTDTIIIIGPHVAVDGANRITPSPLLSKRYYLDSLKQLNICNVHELEEGQSFFRKLSIAKNVSILFPEKIFRSNEQEYLTDNEYAFFRDKWHLSVASTEHVVSRIKQFIASDELPDLGDSFR